MSYYLSSAPTYQPGVSYPQNCLGFSRGFSLLGRAVTLLKCVLIATEGTQIFAKLQPRNCRRDNAADAVYIGFSIAVVLAFTGVVLVLVAKQLFRKIILIALLILSAAFLVVTAFSSR